MLRQVMCRIVLLVSALSCFDAMAGEVQVAVAANFAAPMKQIATQFEQASGHKAKLSVGATGKFYAQIKNGAPFDILLSADQATPTLLVQEQSAVAGSQFTYAIGKLALWSANPTLVDGRGAVLKQGGFAHLAIASPKQAPYGAAAMEVLTALNLNTSVTPKLVQGENIGQTYSFISTGNAELGFVALSQIWENNTLKSGSYWLVPDNLYSPIRQDAVLLKHGKDNPAAAALLAFLKTDKARAIMQSFGYQF